MSRILTSTLSKAVVSVSVMHLLVVICGQAFRRERKCLDHLLGNGFSEDVARHAHPSSPNDADAAVLALHGASGHLRQADKPQVRVEVCRSGPERFRSPAASRELAERVRERWSYSPAFVSHSDSNTFNRCGLRFCHALASRDLRSWPPTPHCTSPRPSSFGDLTCPSRTQRIL